MITLDVSGRYIYSAIGRDLTGHIGRPDLECAGM